jgi:hypothetical protein
MSMRVGVYWVFGALGVSFLVLTAWLVSLVHNYKLKLNGY